MPELSVQFLLDSPTVTIRDVCCQGRCRDKSAEEWATTTELVFPYRGVYVRHLGHDQTVAERRRPRRGYEISLIPESSVTPRAAV